MNKLEWYSEEVKNYYCAEINQEISRGRIYYLSFNGNKGYVLCKDWASKINTITAFGIFERTALALRKEGDFFNAPLNLYDINTSEKIGMVDNNILLRGMKHITDAKTASLFNNNSGYDLKYEIHNKYSDKILCHDVNRITKKWYNTWDTAPVKGEIELPDDTNWELILCSFFSLHNYFLRRRQDD